MRDSQRSRTNELGAKVIVCGTEPSLRRSKNSRYVNSILANGDARLFLEFIHVYIHVSLLILIFLINLINIQYVNEQGEKIPVDRGYQRPKYETLYFVNVGQGRNYPLNPFLQKLIIKIDFNAYPI